MGESVSSAVGPEGHPFQPHTPCPQVLEQLPSQNPTHASAPGLAGPHRFRGGLRCWITFRFWNRSGSPFLVGLGWWRAAGQGLEWEGLCLPAPGLPA